MNKDFLNKNALDSVFYLPFDIDDEDFLWVAKSATTLEKICWYEGCTYHFNANIISLMQFDSEHAVKEHVAEKSITPWVGSFAKHSNKGVRMWFSMKASKDFVWITTLNAILKFEKKVKSGFTKVLRIKRRLILRNSLVMHLSCTKKSPAEISFCADSLCTMPS